MDINNIFVIIGKDWTKEKIVQEILEEGYKHNFSFNEANSSVCNIINQLNISDEIWIFGDVEGSEVYNFVERNKIDVWRMG